MPQATFRGVMLADLSNGRYFLAARRNRRRNSRWRRCGGHGLFQALFLDLVFGDRMNGERHRSRWGSGFVWGCLTPIAVVVLAFAAMLIYSGYYSNAGFKDDASFRTVLHAVQNNLVAIAVLGPDIAVSGTPSYRFFYGTAGHTGSYQFAVRGSKGDGIVGAQVVISNGKTTIRMLKLRGPAGRIYDLLHGKGPQPTHSARRFAPQGFPQPAEEA